MSRLAALGIQQAQPVTGYIQGQQARQQSELQRLKMDQLPKQYAQTNRLNELKIGGMESQQRDQSRLRELMPQAQAGDEQAMNEVATLDYDTWSKMDERQQAEAKQRHEAMSRAAATVLAAPPELRDQAYQQLKPTLAQRLDIDPEQLPPAYDEAQFTGIANQLREVEDIMAGPKLSSTEQKVKAAGYDPRSPEGQAYARRLLEKTSGTNVNIDMGAGKEAETLAKNRADRYDAYQQEAFEAADMNSQLTQMENMDIETGFGEEMKAGAARVFKGLGVNGAEALLGADISSVESFNAVSKQLLSQALIQQKGPQTESDAQRIQETLPNIGNEKLSNRFILSSLKAMNRRKQERADFFTDYLEDNDTLKGAEREWREYMRTTPLVSDSIKDPETGLPMFFYEFKDKFSRANPSAPESAMIEQWRKMSRQ